jgi:hypothetical protein
MSRKIASFWLLGICVVLAILLLINAISPLLGGGIFAAALIILGIASGGFKK